MAGNIKGITIEFRGETTKLDKALRDINNKTKSLDKELKQVDKALKFNPTSVELWRQKQDLLKQKISETKDKLKLLKDEQARMDASGVDKNSAEYQKLRREIIETESKAKTFEGQLRKIGNVNLKAASEQIKQMGSRLEEAGQKMKGLSMAAAGVVAAMGAMVAKSSSWADDLNTMSKVYGIGTDELQKYAAAADLVDVSVETIAGSHTKLKRNMMSAAQGSKAQAEAFNTLGISVTDANGNLRDGDEVWQEVIQSLGKMENETERDALAMQLMGKSASELNPLIEDNGETYKQVADTFAKYGLDYIDQDTLDKANQFQDELDTIKMIGMVTFQQIGSTLAAYLAPALEKVVEWVGKLSQWLQSLSPQTLTIIGIIAAIVAGLAPVLIILGKVATGISSIINLVGMIGPALTFLTGPVGIVIAVIGALIAVGVLLYKNWDKIKAKASEIKANLIQAWTNIKTKVLSVINGLKTGLQTAWNNIKTAVTTAFNAVKNAIITPIQSAINKVKSIIQKIKSFFPIKLGNIFKGLKLPHLKLTGKFSLSPPSVPKLSVDWYKTGGIFDSPSLIGIGEAGPEAVVPLDKLWDKLDRIADNTGGGIVININGANASPREIAEEVKRALIQETNRRRLAWQ